jgi:hypothetical protein
VPEPLPLIVHERIGTWARQLRPRAAGWGARLIESRSVADLRSALKGAACPIVIVDLGDRPRARLEDLGQALTQAPAALAVVLDPHALPGVPTVARQLGATHVMSGETLPPDLLALLARWLPLARRRTEADGWSNARSPANTEPWAGLLPPDPDHDEKTETPPANVRHRPEPLTP